MEGLGREERASHLLTSHCCFYQSDRIQSNCMVDTRMSTEDKNISIDKNKDISQSNHSIFSQFESIIEE